MMDLEWSIDFAILVAEMLLGVMGLFLVGSAGEHDKRLKYFFGGTLLLLMLITACRIALEIAQLYENTDFLCSTVYIIQEVLLLPLFPLLTAYLLRSCGEPLKAPAFYAVCAVETIQAVMVVYYAVIGAPYDLSKYTSPNAGPLIFSFLMGVVLIIVNLVNLVRRWRKLSLIQRVSFIACYILPHPWMILFLEIFLIQDGNRRYREQKAEIIRQRDEIIRQEEELSTQKLQVAVLQMRPHFIYNTLMSIYGLCAQDAARARQVTLDFSSYLKKNFTAIVSEEAIPFTEELEHTRAYLAVEKARFEDKLYVDLDTPVTVFKLPPLTLQPIVENAVKHGISPDLDPLYITVATEDTGDGVRLIVEDTGPGFAPSDDNEPHIALNNIRHRLKTMCGGTMEIAPREQGGTRVMVFVPW